MHISSDWLINHRNMHRRVSFCVSQLLKKMMLWLFWITIAYCDVGRYSTLILATFEFRILDFHSFISHIITIYPPYSWDNIFILHWTPTWFQGDLIFFFSKSINIKVFQLFTENHPTLPHFRRIRVSGLVVHNWLMNIIIFIQVIWCSAPRLCGCDSC